MANSPLKWLYFFDEGVSDRKLLGGKGAGLCEMTSLGLPIPPGFVITTNVCEEFYRERSEASRLASWARSSLRWPRSRSAPGRSSATRPTRSWSRSAPGAPISMPGMMDTILNLGLNDSVVEGLASITGNRRFAYDTYRRFIQLFGKIVLGVDEEEFAKLLDGEKRRRGAAQDSDLDADSMKRVAESYKDLLTRENKPLPQEPAKQLELAIEAVFRSWNGKRAIEYRKQYRITPDQAKGTAVTIVTDGLRQPGERQRHGSALHPRPVDRESAGSTATISPTRRERTWSPASGPPSRSQSCKDEMPGGLTPASRAYPRSSRAHYREPQDIEFTDRAAGSSSCCRRGRPRWARWAPSGRRSTWSTRA